MEKEKRKMNVLNKGRCSRCIASKKEDKELRRDNFEGIKMILNSKNWLKCMVTDNWCRYCAGSCKEPPMGISADDYKKLNIGEDKK